MKIVWLSLLSCVIISISSSCTSKTSAGKESWSFDAVSVRHSGITFQNQIKEDVGTKHNLLDFDYFYNGAGVGVADFDGDGLEDVIFTANQVDNRIYRNLGDLKFQDVTEQSGLNSAKYWSNGVTIVDINEDELPDIYISQGGPHEPAQRKNLLYINQGDFRFIESAEAYGLADEGISTQSVFFDADGDGDLDCFVLNESEIYGYDILPYYRRLLTDEQSMWANSSHFYINEDGRFRENTKGAGLLSPSFGLGVSVADLNEDGHLDLYQANDYYVPDAIWINQGNGSFKDETKRRSRQTSFFGMGVDIADVNGDGKEDIFVLDMAAADHIRSKTLMASMNVSAFRFMVEDMQLPHQYMFNSLQLANGPGQYDNVAHLAGLAKTDWSWAGLIQDYDLDGRPDIYVTNGYRKYALDNDFKTKVLQTKERYNGRVPQEVKEKLYDEIPEEPLSNIMYRQVEPLSFRDVTAELDMDAPSYSNGAAYADLDLDGDLDLIVNNLDGVAQVWENRADQLDHRYLSIKGLEEYDAVTIYYDSDQQRKILRRTTGYRSCMSSILHFGLGQVKSVDSVIIQSQSGELRIIKNVETNQLLDASLAQTRVNGSTDVYDADLLTQVSLAQVKLYFKHLENDFDDLATEILLPYQQSRRGPCIVIADVNGDGRDDVFFGSSFGHSPRLYFQTAEGFSEADGASDLLSAEREEADVCFFDLDGDADLDAYVAAGGNAYPAGSDRYRNRLLINDGSGKYHESDRHEESTALSSSKTIALDFDGDNDNDLIVLERHAGQSYPLGGRVRLLLNDDGILSDDSHNHPALQELAGLWNDLLLTDMTGDGISEIIIVGEWQAPVVLEISDGAFARKRLPELDELSGWWFHVGETDFNQDGQPDYVLGNLGGNSKYKASEKKPLKIFADDFDQTGSLDIVLSQAYKDDYVPFRGKECSSEQMPMIDEKFPAYKAFAAATIEDVYGDDVHQKLAGEAKDFRSKILLSTNDGSYDLRDLPVAAQTHPILDALCLDLDGDGIEDLMVGGNIYETEPETPRLDAQQRSVFLSDGNGGFKTKNQTGFVLDDNVKSLQSVYHHGRDEQLILVGRNDGLIKLFTTRKQDTNEN